MEEFVEAEALGNANHLQKLKYKHRIWTSHKTNLYLDKL